MRLATELADCHLRPWREGDQADLVRIADDRRVWRNLTHLFPHPYTGDDADAWLRIANRPDRSEHLAIEVGGRVAGGIGAIAGEGVAVGTADLGYWLGVPYWGRGIATAAVRAMVGHLEHPRLFARLQSQVFAWNPASMRVLEKAGFTREGVLRNSITKDGSVIDSVMFARVAA